MIALLGSVLATSLAGSPHCAGMCGGFVAFYSGDIGRGRALGHAAYNAGRLVSYAALGALAGLLGAGVDRLGAGAGLTRVAAVLAGGLMILWGAATLFGALGLGARRRPAPPPWQPLLLRAAGAVRVWPAAARAAALGLLSALLPCGFLYAYVAVAAGTGSPWSGALVMAAFWAGTVPVLAGLGLLARRAIAPLRRRLPALTAALLIGLGILTLAGRLAPHPGWHLHRPAAPGQIAPPAPGHGHGAHTEEGSHVGP